MIPLLSNDDLSLFEDGHIFLLLRLRESHNSASTCNLVTETELQILFDGMINSDRVNNVTK